MQKVESLNLDELYKLRSELDDYFHSNFCTLTVHLAFKEKVKTAIYNKLEAQRQGA